MKKTTDAEIAKYYGISARTLYNYRNASGVEERRRWVALRDGYGRSDEIEAAQMDVPQLVEYHERVMENLQDVAAELQIVQDLIAEMIED